MSKDTPEVGDVWEIKDARTYITFLHNGFVDSVCRCCSSSYVYDRTYTVNELVREGKYLGKSKANIDDLFDTENEE